MDVHQIMDFNCGKVGYASAKAMLDDLAKGEDVHIKAMFKFFNETSAMRKLREKDYVGFAFIYNGAGQAEHYGGLIR